MFHHATFIALKLRLDVFSAGLYAEQLKRLGYRDIREPRVASHWANR